RNALLITKCQKLCGLTFLYCCEIQDFICSFGAGLTVRTDTRSAVMDILFNILKDIFFGFGIHSRQAIIKNKNWRLLNPRPGYANTLFLAPRAHNTAFTNPGLILLL